LSSRDSKRAQLRGALAMREPIFSQFRFLVDCMHLYTYVVLYLCTRYTVRVALLVIDSSILLATACLQPREAEKQSLKKTAANESTVLQLNKKTAS
jgi:hypothetical protein